MKTRFFVALLGFGSLLLFCASRSSRSAASALPQYQSAANVQTLTCASEDMHRHTCEVDTSGGVQLIRQRSDSPCLYGRSWGYDQRGIWVDRGCRADFQAGAASWNGWDNGYLIYCSSDDGDRQFCPVRTSFGVRLARQRSSAPCVFGRSWGYNRRGIWVDQGCRADFDLGSGGDTTAPLQTVSCSSDDMRRHDCRADTSSGVRLARQRSDSDCIYGATWGYDDRGIWVDRGCRADFEIGGGDNDGDSDDQQFSVRVYCSSDDLHRRFCYTGRHGAVRLIKIHSEADCAEGRSWGHEPRGIWVDHGCRADFEVVVGGFASGENYNSSRGPATPLTCSSEDGKRHYCSADTRGGVRLVKQRSGSPCAEGSTWGYGDRGVWVDRGCRADFEVFAPR